MPRCRIIAAVILLVLTAGRVVAQVASPTPAPTNPDAVDATPATTSPVPAPTVSVSPVPEPGSVLLLGGPAAVGWVMYWRRKWRAPVTQPGT
jgi:hypothetical protein